LPIAKEHESEHKIQYTTPGVNDDEGEYTDDYDKAYDENDEEIELQSITVKKQSKQTKFLIDAVNFSVIISPIFAYVYAKILILNKWATIPVNRIMNFSGINPFGEHSDDNSLFWDDRDYHLD